MALKFLRAVRYFMTKIQGPNFFIIGAAKSGTTSLSSLLASHPEAGIVRGKEPHYFSQDDCFRMGWKRYLMLFRHCAEKNARGDASTSYSRIRYFPRVIKRIHQRVPHAKIIYMVRHPLKRMESAYIEHLCTPGGQLFRSVNEAVRHLPMIVDSSRYGEVFEAYCHRFGEPRVKVVWFEEYVAQPNAVFREICRFLEISDGVTPVLSAASINSRNDAGGRMAKIGRSHVPIDTKWDTETHAGVVEQIREDNCRFLDHFKRPRDYWGNLF